MLTQPSARRRYRLYGAWPWGGRAGGRTRLLPAGRRPPGMKDVSKIDFRALPAAFSRREDDSKPEKDYLMGDKGGKKDKAKNKRQKVKKQEQKVKTKQDKQLAKTSDGS